MENVSATRMSLLILKEKAASTRKGVELLRSKREALVREFFVVMDQAITSRGVFQETLEGAMDALAVGLGLDGRAAVESAAFAARRDIPAEVTEKNVWGVRFPDIRYQTVIRSSDARGYSLSGVSSHTNTAARRFEEALDAALKMISVDARLKKIGGEIRKTTRRMNALTGAILPELERRIRNIRIALDEREREEIFRMKRFKGGAGCGREDQSESI
ncbi:MAG TPA: V-type ATP synthase subunit D [Candidatus Manganitrophaceae bacterium]|nr:V-type ATP synthase subunit D [Candidatus Manganitrophaceae bacterium]